MSSLNRVFLAGNLTRDPQLKQTGAGQAVADLGLAVNESYKNRDGETVETTCFADIVVWGRQAESCCQYLGKGSGVLVEGCLQFDRWETPEGDARTKLKVRALRVQFIGRPKQAGDAVQAEAGEAMPF